MALHNFLATLVAGALLACSPSPAEQAPATEAKAEAPPANGEELAARVQTALQAGDWDGYMALMKLDGVDALGEQAFERMRASLPEQQVDKVYAEPLDDSFQPFDYNGVTYGLNGTPEGRITIAFAPQPPETASTFSMTYAVEDGRAVLLREVPLDAGEGETP